MFKKMVLAVAGFLMVASLAFANVDANKADQAALDGVKGIGPTTSKRILEERKKGGEFKSWADFEKRVKGVGGKKAAALSDAGLTVNGAPRPASAAKATKSAKSKDTKTADNGSAAK